MNHCDVYIVRLGKVRGHGAYLCDGHWRSSNQLIAKRFSSLEAAASEAELWGGRVVRLVPKRRGYVVRTGKRAGHGLYVNALGGGLVWTKSKSLRRASHYPSRVFAEAVAQKIGGRVIGIRKKGGA